MIKSSHFASASTTFACNLFVRLAESAPDRNVFISPASVALALALAFNGARGDTRRAIAAALGLDDDDADDLNRASAALAQQLGQLGEGVRMAVANSLWASDELRLDEDFVRVARECYGADVRQLNFARDPVAKIINSWVDEQTHGKIERIVDKVDRDALLFLINAIYFKGSWTEPFNRKLTERGAFHLAGGGTAECQLMTQRGRFRYYEDRALQAVGLPYGGGRVCMYLFLPRPGVGLPKFLSELSAKRWEGWMGRFSSMEGRVSLPRFRLAYEAKLNDALRSLGMGIAFEHRADFGALAADRSHIQIDEVRHKAFVEVNEEGTEAAAVTSVGMMRASFLPAKTFAMVMDRPFCCAIRDDQTGAILFMGAILDPS